MTSGRIQILIAVTLMCCTNTINSANTGYFYENPIRPFNPPPFLPLRSTGQYVSSVFGQKVETTPKPGFRLPSIPTYSPLTTLKQTKVTGYQAPSFNTAQTINSFPTLNQQQQNIQIQNRQQQQPFTTTIHNSRMPFQSKLTNTQQQQLPSFAQLQKTTTSQILPTNQNVASSGSESVQAQNSSPTPNQVVSQAPLNTGAVQNIASRAGQTDTNSNSNSQQILGGGLLDSPDIYVVDGRQLKQYKVYEHIDNDIEQEFQIMPENFFLNSFPSSADGTASTLNDGSQIQNRFSGFQQNNQQQRSNAVALGSGGLGFVRLPNGGVYLGSGSLGYINGLQHAEDVQKFRGLSGLPAPDALHFGPVHQ